MTGCALLQLHERENVNTVKSCIKAAACVQLPDFFGRLIFKTGLCAVLHHSDHHKITYCTKMCTQRHIHPTHFLWRVYSYGLYLRLCMLHHMNVLLLFPMATLL